MTILLYSTSGLSLYKDYFAKNNPDYIRIDNSVLHFCGAGAEYNIEITFVYYTDKGREDILLCIPYKGAASPVSDWVRFDRIYLKSESIFPGGALVALNDIDIDRAWYSALLCYIEDYIEHPIPEECYKILDY